MPAAGWAAVAETVYRNGEILTIDEKNRWASAVAIKKGRFIYVGTEQGVDALIGESTHIVDLQGRMAMPGLHDAHQHLLKAQMRSLNCILPGVEESVLEDVLDALTNCPEETRRGDWIVADVYSGTQFPDDRAHRRYLDSLFPDTPVYIREWSYHHGLANSEALRLAGIDENTPEPDGGRILRDEDGKPTGELLAGATWLVTRVIPKLPDGKIREAIASSVRLSNQYGITSAQEASATKELLAAVHALDLKGQWPLRLAAHLVWGNPASAEMSREEQERLLESRGDYESARVHTNFVKLYSDGSPLQPHATDVNIDVDGNIDADRLYLSPTTLNEAVTRFDADGIKVKIHAVGTGAIRVALDAIAEARRRNGNSGIRHEIAHSLRFMDEDLSRVSRLDAVAEMSPAIWQIRGPLTQNLAGAWPFRSLLLKGTLITIGTDWVILPEPNLFPAIAGMVRHGSEAISLNDALTAATLNGAISVGWEDTTGSIEVGKSADMIVLDRKLFEIPVEEVAHTQVLMTMLEGKIVYEHPSFSVARTNAYLE